MDTFMLRPLQSGYSFSPGNNLREQKLEGGMPRQVIKFVGAVHSVSVSVLLKNARYKQYFWAFWRQNQSKIWNWKIAIDGGELEECECKFTAESIPQESERNGRALKATFTILVVPIERDANMDRNIIELWQSGMINSLDDIEKIPNVWMPNALGVKRGS